MAANRIARWDGLGWSPLEAGLSTSVYALATFEDGRGKGLWAGGLFANVVDSGDSYLAKWGCPDTVPPVIACPTSMLVPDQTGGPPGEVVSFTVTATDDTDPDPTVVCEPLSGSFFPRGTTTVTCTATDASGQRSVCQFTIEVKPKVERRRL